MSRKFTSIALPLSFMLLFAFARPSHAATPTATFGVSATVLAGCKVSGAVFHGTFAAAVKHATSAVSIRCSDTTQYSVIVIPDAGPTARVPFGVLNSPLRSLMSYMIPSDAAHHLRWTGMAGTGFAAVTRYDRYFTGDDHADAPAPFVASNAYVDTISVAITY